MHRRSSVSGRTARVLLVMIGLVAIAPPTFASSSFEFLFSTEQVSDDSQFFLNLAVGHYGVPRRELEPYLPRVTYVEADLPVVLFLAQRSGRTPGFIINLRSDGLGWQAVFAKVGVPVTVLFAGIDRDPGPPYGQAWGYWKKRPQEVSLTNAQVVGLAKIQVGSALSGVSAYQLASSRSEVARVVADKKGRPFGGKQAGNPGKGQGKGHGKR